MAVDGHGLPRVRSGEVHDIFDLGDHLLVIATDRVGVNGIMLHSMTGTARSLRSMRARSPTGI